MKKSIASHASADDSLTELSHVAAATQYARDVVSGKIVACKWVRLACQRQLDDLTKSKGSWPYRFDDVAANRVCRFIEVLPHIKGEWAFRRERIKLDPYQQFILTTIFGWLRKDTGARRFREAYISVPRKNAKSTISAGVGLYLLGADQEEGSEVFAGNVSEGEAWKILDPAIKMIRRSPELQKLFGFKAHAAAITVAETGSSFKTLIGKPADGDSPHGVCIDEYHQFDSDELFDAMRSGMGARRQPLIVITTTAGYNVAGPCYAMQRDLEQVLEGTLERESLFGIVYTIDEGDDWTSELALRKANPMWGKSVNATDMLDLQKTAVQSARKQNLFKTKHLNIWCSAATGWINMQQWRACGDTSLRIDEFKGQTCIGGLDLASVGDISARVFVFRRVIENKEHFYAFPKFYVPQEWVDDPANQNYLEWVKNDHMIATDGNETDFGVIREDLIADCKLYKVKSLAFDDYQSVTVKQDLLKEVSSLTAVSVDKRVKFFSEPAKWLESLIKGGRLHHDGNPVMQWMVSNVVIRPDRNDNILPQKDPNRPDQKIDGVDALLYAMTRVHLGELKQTTKFFKPRVI